MGIIAEIILLLLILFGIYKIIKGGAEFIVDFWELCEELYDLLEDFLESLASPFIELYKIIKKRLRKYSPFQKENFLTRFTDNHPVLGTPISIIFVVCSVLFLSGTAIIYPIFGNSDFINEALRNLPFFFVWEGFDGGFDFSFNAIVGMGISVIFMGLLPKIFMKNYYINSFSTVMVSVVHYFLTTLVSAVLGFILSGTFAKLTNLAIWLFNIFRTNVFGGGATASGWVKAILSLIPFLIILYLGLIVLIAAVRDFIDMLCYGVIGCAGALAVGLLWHIVAGIAGGWDGIAFKIVFGIVGVICIFGIDYYRVNKENIIFKRKRK